MQRKKTVSAEKTLVISLGGSLIAPKGINVAFLKRFRALILKHVKKGRRFIIVCGGGAVNRAYNKALKKIVEPDNDTLDLLGIAVTYVNAFFVKSLFGKYAYEQVVNNPTAKIKTNKPVIVGCGWKPGCSTDKDAVLLAKNLKASRVINLTDVAYVYTKNPKKFRGAKKIERMSWSEFRKLFGGKWAPKLSTPFDPIAAKIAQQFRLNVTIAKGADLKNLEHIISGRRFKGTVIG